MQSKKAVVTQVLDVNEEEDPLYDTDYYDANPMPVVHEFDFSEPLSKSNDHTVILPSESLNYNHQNSSFPKTSYETTQLNSPKSIDNDYVSPDHFVDEDFKKTMDNMFAEFDKDMYEQLTLDKADSHLSKQSLSLKQTSQAGTTVAKQYKVNKDYESDIDYQTHPDYEVDTNYKPKNDYKTDDDSYKSNTADKSNNDYMSKNKDYTADNDYKTDSNYDTDDYKTEDDYKNNGNYKHESDYKHEGDYKTDGDQQTDTHDTYNDVEDTVHLVHGDTDKPNDYEPTLIGHDVATIIKDVYIDYDAKPEFEHPSNNNNRFNRKSKSRDISYILPENIHDVEEFHPTEIGSIIAVRLQPDDRGFYSANKNIYSERSHYTDFENKNNPGNSNSNSGAIQTEEILPPELIPPSNILPPITEEGNLNILASYEPLGYNTFSKNNLKNQQSKSTSISQRKYNADKQKQYSTTAQHQAHDNSDNFDNGSTFERSYAKHIASPKHRITKTEPYRATDRSEKRDKKENIDTIIDNFHQRKNLFHQTRSRLVSNFRKQPKRSGLFDMFGPHRHPHSSTQQGRHQEVDEHFENSHRTSKKSSPDRHSNNNYYATGKYHSRPAGAARTSKRRRKVRKHLNLGNNGICKLPSRKYTIHAKQKF